MCSREVQGATFNFQILMPNGTVSVAWGPGGATVCSGVLPLCPLCQLHAVRLPFPLPCAAAAACRPAPPTAAHCCLPAAYTLPWRRCSATATPPPPWPRRASRCAAAAPATRVPATVRPPGGAQGHAAAPNGAPNCSMWLPPLWLVYTPMPWAATCCQPVRHYHGWLLTASPQACWACGTRRCGTRRTRHRATSGASFGSVLQASLRFRQT